MGFWNDGGFFSSVKGHVIKWWQLVIMPVLRINNNGHQNPYTAQQAVQPEQPQHTMQQPVQPQQVQLQSVEQQSVVQQEVLKVQEPVQTDVEQGQNHAMTTEDPMEVLRRINEEKEAARRKEIEKAKKKASEEARIVAIMNANKVDVNAFIEAGKAAKEEIAAKKSEEQEQLERIELSAQEKQSTTAVQITADIESEQESKQEEDLRKAQEIMERLNREAAEDEARKRAEIEAARQEAKKKFG